MNKNSRKKQPLVVRVRLLEAAAQVAVERGVNNLSLDAVARRAGVSKGGLIHHFPSRQALLRALFHDLLTVFADNIEAFMARDREPRGRFTRAYVRATALPPSEAEAVQLMRAFALAMSNDTDLGELWRCWLQLQLENHPEDAASPIGRLIRYAADGIWLEACMRVAVNTSGERAAVIERLVEMTHTL